MNDRPRTYVYIDGFNFYYGAVKDIPYKWLNFERLCSLLLPRSDVLRIKYFTARVRPVDWNRDAPRRQKLFLRALKTLPKVEIIFGNFRSDVKKMAVAEPGWSGPRWIQVHKHEEKRSDVNLATHLLCDAFDNLFDVAAIITNDSDLVLPIRIVKEKFQKKVAILYPSRRKLTTTLAELADFRKEIRESHLKASLFPDTLEDCKGSFSKPDSW